MAIAITIRNLKKAFRTHTRGAGLLEAAKSLIFRKYETITALKNINLKVHEGGIAVRQYIFKDYDEIFTHGWRTRC